MRIMPFMKRKNGVQFAGVGLDTGGGGGGSGGGAVDSVNGQTGAVVIDADDISDSNTTNKFVTASEKLTWNSKQNALTAGTNIGINGRIISATNTIALNYSTSEQVVGRWTDGKPLYEKTISFTLPNSANIYKTIATLTNANKVRSIDWHGLEFDSNNQAFINNAIYFNYVYSSNAFQVATTSAFGEKSAVVTVLYTKTTD